MRTRVVVLCLAAWGAASLGAAAQPQGDELVASCTPCHGEKGASSEPTYPNIGGQTAGYLRSVMTWFRSGQYPSDVMGPLVKDFNDAQIAALAKYFASQPWTSAPQKLDPAKVARGLQLATKASCAKCHGTAGATIDQETPRIGGQWEQVLEAQLAMYQGPKIKIPENLMQSRLKGMSADDLAALAAYFGGLK
jgi:cytochrome subunit of sulfide dehydrogenase